MDETIYYTEEKDRTYIGIAKFDLLGGFECKDSGTYSIKDYQKGYYSIFNRSFNNFKFKENFSNYNTLLVNPLYKYSNISILFYLTNDCKDIEAVKYLENTNILYNYISSLNITKELILEKFTLSYYQSLIKNYDGTFYKHSQSIRTEYGVFKNSPYLVCDYDVAFYNIYDLSNLKKNYYPTYGVVSYNEEIGAYITSKKYLKRYEHNKELFKKILYADENLEWLTSKKPWGDWDYLGKQFKKDSEQLKDAHISLLIKKICYIEMLKDASPGIYPMNVYSDRTLSRMDLADWHYGNSILICDYHNIDYI